jgi:hypothetical protein
MTDLCPQAKGFVGSRPLYYSGGLRGPAGTWVDGVAFQGTQRSQTDEKHHLAQGEGRGFESCPPLSKKSVNELG